MSRFHMLQGNPWHQCWKSDIHHTITTKYLEEEMKHNDSSRFDGQAEFIHILKYINESITTGVMETKNMALH